MQTRTKTRKLISLLLTFAMIFSILPSSLNLANADDELILVWEANLTGATVQHTDGVSNRNYVVNPEGKGLGFLTGSGTIDSGGTDFGQQVFIEDGKIRYSNTRSSNMPLRIVTGGNGWNAEAGFTPEPDKKYLLKFDATDSTGTAPGTFKFSTTGAAGTRDPAAAVPVSGNSFERVIEWPNGAAADGVHGTAVIGMCIETGSTVVFSNIKIYEAPAGPPVCDTCGSETCEGCTANAIYNMQYDPFLFEMSGTAGSPSGALNAFLKRSGGDTTSASAKLTAPRTISVSGRGGTSQGIRIKAGAFADVVLSDHSYKIEYSGTFPNNPTAVARIAVEAASREVLATKAAVGGNFTVSVVRTAEQITADTAFDISLANVTDSIDIIYTDIIIYALCPATCDGCELILPDDICKVCYSVIDEEEGCLCCDVCNAYPCECVCEVCGKLPCECPCEVCGEFPCNCPCEECGQPRLEECICCVKCKKLDCICPLVLAKWEFTAENYPNAVAPNPSDGEPINAGWASAKELDASSGEIAEKSKLIRNHDPRYPDGSNASGTPLDNTRTIKHMDVYNGALRTFGWSTALNYIYLKLDTTEYDHLTLRYDILTNSGSTPGELKLQYSFDGETWKTAGKEVITRPNGSWLSYEHYLPVSTNEQSELYIRWFGSSSSTSGRVEFKDISLEQCGVEERLSCKHFVEVEAETDFFYASLTPGATPASMGVSWFTTKDAKDTAIVQVVKKSDLVDGTNMPVTPTEFVGVNAAGSSLYDTNKATVTGLEPSTEYAYRVGDGETWSKIYNFTTQDPTSYKVMVVADPQVSSSAANWKNTVERSLTRFPESAFVLSAGDQTSEANLIVQVDGYISPPKLRNYPFAATYGNHDHIQHETGEKNTWYLPLLYNWPNAVEVADSTLKGHDYYFSYGDVLYINLDSNIKAVESHEALVQEAKDSHPDATWTILTFHHDIYGGSRHAGSYYADASAMQKTWGPFLEKWEVDLAFNGHDHLYARSKFMSGDNVIERFQMSADFSQSVMSGLLYNPATAKKNPGAFINPKGTQYMALATPGDKFYELEKQTWQAYADDQSNQPEYTIMSVTSEGIVIETYRYNSVTDTEKLVDSITLRKKALREDLEKMLPDAKKVELGDIKKGWDEFQAALDAAQIVLDNVDATADEIHDAFVLVYETYFALDTEIDLTELFALIDEATEVYDNSKEGLWLGQYPRGSRAVLKALIDEAIAIGEKYLATQEDVDKVLADLETGLELFLTLVSDIPCPWETLHTISATGVNEVDLIGWMDEGLTTPQWGDKVERYDSNLTKKTFAKDSGGQRTEPSFGPANKDGGRGAKAYSYINKDGVEVPFDYTGGHISDTHIGEWIRYELNAEKAGMYEVKLGAINTTAAIQTIVLRNANQDVVATFEVPANHEKAKTWETAEMVSANNNQLIYLPEGKSIIEIYFKNTGATVANNTAYTAGADVDILTFEFKEDGDAPELSWPLRDDKYFLPMHPFAPANADTFDKQRGWGTGKAFGEVPVAMFNNATHLVLELATNSVFPANSSSFQFVIHPYWDMPGQGNIGPATLATYWDASTNTLRLPLDHFPQMRAHLDKPNFSGAILLCYYATGWNELNIMRAWLQLELCDLCGEMECPGCCEGHDFGTVCGTKCNRKGCTVNFECEKADCVLCNPPTCVKGCLVPCTHYTKGDVNGSGVVDIQDAVQILCYLAKLDSSLKDGVLYQPSAWNAAKIVPTSIAADKPAIQDAVDVLCFLAKLNSIIKPL